MQKQKRAQWHTPRLLTIHTEFGLSRAAALQWCWPVRDRDPLPLKSKKFVSHENHGVATLQLLLLCTRALDDTQLNITNFQL